MCGSVAAAKAASKEEHAAGEKQREQHDPLLFLLQIKMIDVHSEKGVDTLLSVLPKDGVLSFFYGGDHSEQYCKVLYTAEEQVGAMVPRAPPALPGQDYQGV